MSEEITYVRDGYEGNAMLIVEKRGGLSKHIWHGYYDGGNIVKMYPIRPWGTMWDGRTRKPMKLSIFEIKRGGES